MASQDGTPAWCDLLDTLDGVPTVRMTLPTPGAAGNDGRVVVADAGGGMVSVTSYADAAMTVVVEAGGPFWEAQELVAHAWASMQPMLLGDPVAQMKPGVYPFAGGSDADPYRCSVQEVADLLRARTKNSVGDEVGTFDTTTRPTADQVEAHITAAVALVQTRLPAQLGEDFTSAVVSLVAYRAALRVEKSYYPEQVASGRSAYEQLRQEYLDDLEALLGALGESGGAWPGGQPGHRAGSEPTPTYLRVYGNRYGGWPWYYLGAIPFGGYDYWPEPENPQNWADPHQPPHDPPQPHDLPIGNLPTKGVGDPPGKNAPQ
jgi:hypothetical protein